MISFFYDFDRFSDFNAKMLIGFPFESSLEFSKTFLIKISTGKKQPPKPRPCQKLETSIFEHFFILNF